VVQFVADLRDMPADQLAETTVSATLAAFPRLLH